MALINEERSEVLKSAPNITLEEIHRDENTTIEDVEPQFLHAFCFLEWGEINRAQLAHGGDQKIDKGGLESRIIPLKNSGEPVSDSIELSVCLVQKNSQPVIEGLVDIPRRVQGIRGSQIEIRLQQFIFRSHQLIYLRDDSLRIREEIPDLRSSQIVDSVE